MLNTSIASRMRCHGITRVDNLEPPAKYKLIKKFYINFNLRYIPIQFKPPLYIYNYKE